MNVIHLPKNPRYFYIFLLIIVHFGLMPCRCFGATIHVPDDQQTIQGGIDAAANGDLVLVADGTYTGQGNQNIDFRGKTIRVESENGPENCIVDCQDTAQGFLFFSGEEETTVLSGFMIVNSSDIYTGAIVCLNSSPFITNCIVNGNKRNGIYCENASPKILKCVVNENEINGIYCNEGCSPTIRGCTVSKNLQGIIVNGSGSIAIFDCEVCENEAGGIGCDSGTIEGCIISNNGEVGISCQSTLIRGCIISGNRNTGIFCNGGSPEIDKCVIRDNTTWAFGAGIYVGGCTSATITNSLIIGNTAGKRSGGLLSESTPLTLTNCTVAHNKAESIGGVSLSSGSSIIMNTIIWHNTPDTNSMDDSVSVMYSDVVGYTGIGTGNIDEAPLFEGEGNYRLSKNSPCIDKGTAAGAPTTDIEGSSRPKGWGFDMGAYEISPILYVSKNDGTCGNNSPCYISIHNAITEAGTGSIILISDGFYDEAVAMNADRSIDFKGGWDLSFETQNGNTVLRRTPEVMQGELTFQEVIFKPN